MPIIKPFGMNKKILIVDDKKEHIQTVINFILKEGIPYALLCAPNGKKAVEIARKECLDIIVMDWEMPGMSGIEAIKLLRQFPGTAEIPVVVATAFRLSPDDLKIAFEAGASDFIRKPIEETEFLARMNSHLKMSGYIRTIREQQNAMATAQKRELNDKIMELKNRISENESQHKYMQNILETTITKLEKAEGCGAEALNGIKQVADKLRMSVKSLEMIHLNTNIPGDIFVKNLLDRYPGLTPGEIQLSFMIKNNLSSKEIATITFREEASVKVARSRLRKKIGLSPEENLPVHLQKF